MKYMITRVYTTQHAPHGIEQLLHKQYSMPV